ncbi:nitronate monooxygenase [Bradyrhizobium sp. WSM1743]|uniref:nitronate monooxygenase n=1 Tax=Bradyrhizobium sp. WSM1743 TaxID=318996 RepID=UPI003528B9D5
MLAPWRADIDTVRQQIRETRALTSRPFGVNLVLDFPQEEHLRACLDEGVPVISFFWRDPSSLARQARAAGATVLHTVGSVAEAKRAVEGGVDVVIAQAGRQAVMSAARWRQCRSCPTSWTLYPRCPWWPPAA